jgi:hypothetical protein
MLSSTLVMIFVVVIVDDADDDDDDDGDDGDGDGDGGDDDVSVMRVHRLLRAEATSTPVKDCYEEPYQHRDEHSDSLSLH